jgi:hypothetical protein
VPGARDRELVAFDVDERAQNRGELPGRADIDELGELRQDRCRGIVLWAYARIA